jgi:hypothetical protein
MSEAKHAKQKSGSVQDLALEDTGMKDPGHDQSSVDGGSAKATSDRSRGTTEWVDKSDRSGYYAISVRTEPERFADALALAKLHLKAKEQEGGEATASTLTDFLRREFSAVQVSEYTYIPIETVS